MSGGTNENSEREELRRARRERAETAGYDTGYAKPPEKHRFKKGHRPTRSSKPRNSRLSRIERLIAIGAEKVAVTEEGRRRTYSKAEIVDRALYHDAMRGDPRARSELLKSWREVDVIETAKQVERDNQPDYRKILINKIEEMAARWEASRSTSPDNREGGSK
jgi:hypothetical protein